MSEEDIQKKYLELQILEGQIKQLQQQMQMMEQQLMELASLSESVEQISKVKPKTEMLIPLGAGVYAKGELKDNKELIMNVGANTTVAKSFTDAKKIIEDQLAQVKGILEQLSGQLDAAAMSGHRIQKELQAAVNSSEDHSGHSHP